MLPLIRAAAVWIECRASMKSYLTELKGILKVTRLCFTLSAGKEAGRHVENTFP